MVLGGFIGLKWSRLVFMCFSIIIFFPVDSWAILVDQRISVKVTGTRLMSSSHWVDRFTPGFGNDDGVDHQFYEITTDIKGLFIPVNLGVSGRSDAGYPIGPWCKTGSSSTSGKLYLTSDPGKGCINLKVGDTIFIWPPSESQLAVTQVQEYMGRTQLKTHRADSDFRIVPKGTKVSVLGRSFSTIENSESGFLYFPLENLNDFHVGSLLSIQSLQTIVTSVKQSGGYAVIKTNKSGSVHRFVDQNQKIKVGNQYFFTQLSSDDGSVYLPASSLSKIEPGDAIHFVANSFHHRGFSSFPYKRSDILFSDRNGLAAKTLDGQVYPDSAALDHAKRYNANHLVWRYPVPTGHMVKDFRAMHQEANCSITPYLSEEESDDQLCLDIHGRPAGYNGLDGHHFADVFHTTYREQSAAEVAQAAINGCTSLQHDDAGMNAQYLSQGGCHSPKNDQLFLKYLKDRYSSNELGHLGVYDTQSFKYSEYLRTLESRGHENLYLHEAFKEFTYMGVVDYYSYLRDVAEKQMVKNTSIGCNLNGVFKPHMQFLYNVCDYFMTERHEYTGTAPYLAMEATFHRNMDRRVVSTLASVSPYWNRVTMKMEYALGRHMIVPYDVYIGRSERLVLPPEMFSEFTGFVRSKAHLFDGYRLHDVYGYQQDRHAITKVTYKRGLNETYINFSGSSDFKKIKKGDRFKIGGVWLKQVTNTNYAILKAAGNVTDIVKTGQLLQALQLGNKKRAFAFKRKFDNGLPTISRSIFRTQGAHAGMVELRIFSNSPVFQEIGAESRLLIKGGEVLELVEKQTSDDSLESVVFFKSSEPRPDLAGKSVLGLHNPKGRNFDLRQFTGPKVKDVVYEEGDHQGVTTLRLTEGPSNIPKGSYIKIGGKWYVTKVATGVGNWYIAGNLLNVIRKGEPVEEWNFGGTKRRFLSADNGTPKKQVNVLDANVVVAVRENSQGDRLFHVARANEQEKWVNIHFDAKSIFGRKVTSLRLHRPGSGVMILSVSDLSKNGWQSVKPHFNGRGYLILEPVF